MTDNRTKLTRRKFLSGSAIAVAGLAGCTGSSSDTPATSESTSTTTVQSQHTTQTTTTETPTTTEEGDPEFKVSLVDAPQEVELGEKIHFSLKVENIGNGMGTFESTLSYTQSGYDEWHTFNNAASITLRSGQSRTTDWWVKPAYQGTCTVRVDETNETFQTAVAPHVLSFGETWSYLDKMAVTIDRVEFFDSYRWSSGDYTYDETAPQGKKWAKVFLSAKNNASEAMYTPLSSEMYIIAGNRQYDDTYLNDDKGEYEGGEIQPGIIRDGWIVYEVPKGLSKDDLAVTWVGDDYYGSWSARWTTSG